ncbi:MAG: hypothetical protein IPM71_00170 [Bacteroidota bacterium]|nr:MAG: hypothetical protein IPM71_00170 [Bacteroidota bacterium]
MPVRGLIEEILMTGVYAINAELGLILTGSQILVNSVDGQRALEKAKSEVNAGSIGFQLPQGPTYIKQGS